MAGHKLVTTVHVHDVDGETVVYGPGDDVPADVAKRVTNPKAWGEPEAPKPAAKSAAKRSSSE